jgi:transglutaminase-like putative cysteine protease/glutamine cyclotransferase
MHRFHVTMLAAAAALWCAAAPAVQHGDVLSTFTTPGPNITGTASDGETLWVADRKADVITAIDLASGEVKATHTAPGFRPVGLAHDGASLWIADLQFARAFRMDPDTGQVLQEIHLPGSGPQGLAFDGEHLWLADRKSKKIFEMSTTDGTVVSNHDQPARGVTGLAFHDGWLWAANRLDDEIYQIDPEEGLVVNVYPAPGPHAWGLAPGGGGRLLVADYQQGNVAAVSTTGDAEPYVVSETKVYDLTYTVDVWNYGKDPLSSLEVCVALPEQRENQAILSGPVYADEPAAVKETSMGQRYAHWLFDGLSAPGRAQVVLEWAVELSRVDWFINPDEVTDDHPKQVRKVYLADTEKYLLDDPYIRKVVNAVVGDEKNPYWKARRLYEWEIERLSYELAGGHENAPQVLERGNGSCSEYTFSYVSLCRAAGVPARYVGSLVVRKDDASTDDVFHRWAEIHLPPYGWVPVDVNHGDKPTPRGRALGFGHLTNNLLVTTVEGPVGENALDWSYNSAADWTFTGTAKVYEEPIAEWRPRVEEQ